MTTADESDAVAMGHVSLKVLSWADLVLDSDNPRLDEAGASTRESVNVLLDLDSEKMINLARDISDSGMLSPFDLPGVVCEDDAYVVVEGNRRVAALKMLKAPDLIDDSRIRRRVEAIAAKGTGPDDVACSLFENRERARRWIELRHTGENEGRGLSPWDSDMANRFSREPGSQTDLAMQLRDLMIAAYPGDTDLGRQLETIFRGGYATSGQRVRKRPTTLGRLLDAPQIQEAFGFSVDEGNIVLIGAVPDVHIAFRQMIFDVSEGLTTRDINKREQINEYIAQCADIKVAAPAVDDSEDAPPSESSEPASLSSSEDVSTAGGAAGVPDPDESDQEHASAGSPPPRPRRRMPRVERKIFEGLKLNKFALETSKTLAQAQRADIDTMPAVTGVMVRVIVELCVTEAIEKLGLNSHEGDKLHKKIRVCLLHLDSNIESARCDKTLEPAWINSQKSSGDGLGVVLMNAFVHGIHKSSAPSEVRSLSSDYKPMLQRLNDALP